MFHLRSVADLEASATKKVFPNVEPSGILLSHNLLAALRKAWDSANDLAIEEFPLEVKVSYENFAGKSRYESAITLLYLPYNELFARGNSLRSNRPEVEVVKVSKTRFLRLS